MLNRRFEGWYYKHQLHDDVIAFIPGKAESGTSFPSSYQWLQCNDFDEPCSIMASIAHIPFCGSSFTGFICAIVRDGREYRFATYNGARILAADEGHIRLSLKRLLLEIDVAPSHSFHPLQAPVRG